MAEQPYKTGRAAFVVTIAVMCSRVLGLAREVIFNGLFKSEFMDVFIVAFRIPNLLRDLFAEGALSTAFITVFSKKSAVEGDESAWRLANRVGSLTFVVMSVITLLGMYFSDELIGMVGGGLQGPYADAAAELTRVMFPFILMVSIGAQIMGMLNAKHVFGWPAMASSFFNIGSIVGGVYLAYRIDPTFQLRGLMGLAIGTLIGGFLQLVVQLPSLYRVGYRWKPDFKWRDSGVLEVMKIMAPAVIAASAVQINVMVNTSFATHCGPGAATWLNNSFRLMQLPLGLFGVAVGTVTLPLLARYAGLGKNEEFVEALSRGMRLVFFLTLPASVGLWMLAEPIMGIIYERGAVTPFDVQQMGVALRYYAIGLAAYSGIKVLAPAFYAVGKRKTPMMVSFFSVALNFGLNSLFVSLGWGHGGLALSTGLVALTNFILLYLLMRRHTGVLQTSQLISSLIKVGIAAAAMGFACWICSVTILAGWQEKSFLMRAGFLGVAIVFSMGVFAGVGAVLRLPEMRDVIDVVKRKLLR